MRAVHGLASPRLDQAAIDAATDALVTNLKNTLTIRAQQTTAVPNPFSSLFAFASTTNHGHLVMEVNASSATGNFMLIPQE